MGNIPGNPLDESTQTRIRETVEKIISTFTREYPVAYALALVDKVKNDINEEPSPEWKLQHRRPPYEIIKTGWAFKKGAVRKNWKKRFLVIKPDYNTDYFDKEISQEEFLDYWVNHESFEAPTPTDQGKQREELRKKFRPKGTMNLVGYTVRTMNKNNEEEFEGKENGIEIWHSNKRCWYVVFNNIEERDSWEEAFRLCCRFAKPYENPDPVAAAAFETAFTKTRQAIGRWGYWWSQGSEEERLADLIVSELNREILNDIYNNLSGPPKVQATIRNTVQKSVKQAVSPPVSAAWSACLSGVNQSRPTLEATCKEKLGPLMEAEKELRTKIEDAVMSKINPVLDSTVNQVMPSVLKLADEIPRAIKAGLELYDRLIEEVNSTMGKSGKAAAHPLLNRMSRDLRWWRWSHMRPITDITEELRKKLDTMDKFIKFISPWNISEHIRFEIAILIDDALYTFEQELNEATKDLSGTDVEAEKIGANVALSVKKKLIVDGTNKLVDQYKYLLSELLLPPFEENCVSECKDLVQPLTPPEELQSLISPPATLEDLLNSIVENVIDSAVESGAKPVVNEIRSVYPELITNP